MRETVLLMASLVFASTLAHAEVARTQFRGLYIGQSKIKALDRARILGSNMDVGYTTVVRMPGGTTMTSFECPNKQGTNYIETRNDIVIRMKLYACFFEYDTKDLALFGGAIRDAYKTTEWRRGGIASFADTSKDEALELHKDGYLRPYIEITAKPTGKF